LKSGYINNPNTNWFDFVAGIFVFIVFFEMDIWLKQASGFYASRRTNGAEMHYDSAEIKTMQSLDLIGASLTI